MSSIDISDNEKPRAGKNAEKPGSYETIFRIISPVIDPGDPLEIEQYFSGYGLIDNAKLMLYSSDDIFDPENSIIAHSLDRGKNGGITFGSAENVFKHTGMFFDLSSGFRLPAWENKTYFFDLGTSTAPQISTETKIKNAPFTYNLLTKKSIKPGNYHLEFCFTYYNGQEWKSDSKSIEFKVRNFLERHDVLIGSLALFASIIAIISVGIIPIVKFILTLFN